MKSLIPLVAGLIIPLLLAGCTHESLSASASSSATRTMPERPLGRAEFYPLFRCAALAGDEFAVELLLKHGADPSSHKDYDACYKTHGYGTEPESYLSLAAYAGHLEVVRMLVEAGADLDARAGEGQTPLWQASWQGHTEVVRYLLSRGARRDLKGQGLTPLEMARKHGFEETAEVLQTAPVVLPTSAPKL